MKTYYELLLKIKKNGGAVKNLFIMSFNEALTKITIL